MSGDHTTALQPGDRARLHLKKKKSQKSFHNKAYRLFFNQKNKWIEVFMMSLFKIAKGMPGLNLDSMKYVKMKFLRKINILVCYPDISQVQKISKHKFILLSYSSLS